MSALTSVFDFLYVYLRALFCYITGSVFQVYDFTDPDQIDIARQIIITGSYGRYENAFVYPGKPILILFISIFTVGSLIGLIRRLMR